MDLHQKLLEKYYLKPGSKLVYYEVGTNGVDCWFDKENFRQHRCLEFKDFDTIERS